MLILVARINIYSFSHRLTRSLLSKYSVSSNNRQYYHSESETTQSQFSDYLINLHSWKLTHRPHQPTLHWSSRFRQQFEIGDEEEQLSVDWDSWFQQHQSSTLILLSQQNHNLSSQDQLPCVNLIQLTSMPKRSRESSSSTNISNKHEKYIHRKFSFVFKF